MRLIDPIRLKMEICMNNILERGKTLEEIIDDTPDADAAPVVHGRWKYHKYVEKYECYECLECRHFVRPGTDRNYCPNCGAKMDLPKDGE